MRLDATVGTYSALVWSWGGVGSTDAHRGSPAGVVADLSSVSVMWGSQVRVSTAAPAPHSSRSSGFN